MERSGQVLIRGDLAPVFRRRILSRRLSRLLRVLHELRIGPVEVTGPAKLPIALSGRRRWESVRVSGLERGKRCDASVERAHVLGERV
jgi:hypothetical protein